MVGAAGGLILALPPTAWWPLAWLAPVPLLALAVGTSPRRALALGGSWGALFYLGVLYWAHGVMVRYGGLSGWVAAGPLALLVIYLALDFALFVWAVSAAVRRWGRGALWIAPVLWTGLEWSRGWVLGGIPWALLGASLSGVPALLAPAAWIGGYGLGTLIVLGWVWLAQLWSGGWSGRRRATAAAIGAVALALMTAAGAARARWIEALPRELRVACLQVNVSQAIKWSAAHRTEILEAHRAMTREAAAGGAKLVLWPESSLPYDPGEPVQGKSGPLSVEAWVAEQARAGGVDILWGGTTVLPRQGGGIGVRNSALLSRADGAAAARYDKRRLVPFGEYVPFERWLTFARPLVHRVGEFEPGEGVVVQQAAGAALGTTICYEILFPELVRQSARGTQILASLSNDAWFGSSSAPHLHLAAAPLRAVETGLAVARAANTGISSLVLPSGRLVMASRIGERRVLLGELPLRGVSTFHRRHGDVWARGCAMIAAACLAWLAVAPLPDASRERAP